MEMSVGHCGTLLTPMPVAKPWGRTKLPAQYGNFGDERIGEIWFDPPAHLQSLLVKYIFTNEKLSVQVHPSDDQARAMGEKDRGGGGGKDECWLIIDAEPEAKLAAGFKIPIDAKALVAAAIDGSVEDLLVWHPVQKGDFFYIPAGTVHAIGAGITLIEIQQNADITYRLYDYGRPRELHLDQAVEIADRTVYPDNLHQRLPERGTIELIDGRYFQLHRVDGAVSDGLASIYDGPCLVVPLNDGVRLAGCSLPSGQCAHFNGIRMLEFAERSQCLVIRPKS